MNSTKKYKIRTTLKCLMGENGLELNCYACKVLHCSQQHVVINIGSNQRKNERLCYVTT